MADSSRLEKFDDLFFDHNETVNNNDNHTSTSIPLLSTIVSLNEFSLPINQTSSSSYNEEENNKKRKSEQKPDLNESKKSKQAPSYMRRNIRQLYKNDQLQVDTLSALQAEQDRLKRLDEINQQYHFHTPLYNHTSINTSVQLKKPLKEHECIVLDDDDAVDNESSGDDDDNDNDGDDDDDDDDDNEQKSLLSLNANSDKSKRTVNKHDDNDSNDSDVQSIDGDAEFVNDKLAKRLQRLHVDDRINIPDDTGNILININHPSDDPDLYISKHLCPILKPHQVGGIRFMYDNIVESLQRFQATAGLGCILAHSMGCGKTLQVIAFIDILFRYTKAKLVLIVVPINTIQNWAFEFNRWCPIEDPSIEYRRPYQLYILNDLSKKFTQRATIVQNWSRTGGTLLIGYEMFRLLVTKKTSKTVTPIKNNYNIQVTNKSSPSASISSGDFEENEKNQEIIEDVRNILINPDLVICDEGHRIKNHQASVAMALKSIRTKRRIVLTGYPLQNNLIEYWCMVDFVRPNYLGSKKEFSNMFERPILNGQCMDSTAEDERVMRARSHVLHSLLEGFIQRRGHSVLQTTLPSKTEYVILLKLSDVQRELYLKFLEAVGALSKSSERAINPLRAFAICCKIWNHADVLYKFIRDRQDEADLDLDLEFDQNSNSLNKSLLPKTRSNNRLAISNNPSSPISLLPTTTTTTMNDSSKTMYSQEKKESEYDFANSILNSYICGQLSNGSKFQVAFTIIDLSIRIGDKVLLFSQSLLSLNKLEDFLSQRTIPDTEQKWQKNLNYFRLDGSTNSLEREKLINAFNAPNSNVKLFLISTRAGCLGINLMTANRVIVMDVSWNPCLDAQAVCRVYRYGQQKQCYIYRLIADFTMEKRIYDRQIAKQGMSDRVIDELQPQTQFTSKEVRNLIHFAIEQTAAPDLLEKVDEISDDPILLATCKQHAQSITKIPFTHESLLLDHKEYQLSSAEKRRAQKDYQCQKERNAYSYRARYNSPRTSSLFFNNSSSNNNHNNNSNDRYSINQPPVFPSPFPPVESRFSMYNRLQTTDRKLEELKEKGIKIQLVFLRSPLQVQMNGFERATIPAGIRIHLIKSSNGSYIRTPDGKFFSIRQSVSTAISNVSSATSIAPQSTQVLLPQATPSPPPPPSRPAYIPPLSNSFEDLLSNFSTLPTSDASSGSLLNDLTDEIDNLLDDKTFPSTSPLMFDNLNSWDNYFQQNNFNLNLFPDQSNTLMSSNNNDGTNDFISDLLTFS